MNGKKMVKSNIGEVEIIGFFDLNKEPIKEIRNIINKEEVIKHQNYPPPPSSECYVYNARRDDDGNIETVIVAVPLLQDIDLHEFVLQTLNQNVPNVIINGTGRYTYHGPIADCGITGRKLACDFYSTASPIGGGSPWTKDASKADLTLNLFARKLALQYLEDNDECFVYLSSCIGQSDLPSATVKTIKNGVIIYL